MQFSIQCNEKDSWRETSLDPSNHVIQMPIAISLIIMAKLMFYITKAHYDGETRYLNMGKGGPYLSACILQA